MHHDVPNREVKERQGKLKKKILKAFTLKMILELLITLSTESIAMWLFWSQNVVNVWRRTKKYTMTKQTMK